MNNKWMSIIEGLLFINGDEGTTINDISTILEIDDEEIIIKHVEGLKDKYKNDSACGLDIQKFAGNKYRLITKKEDVDYYVKLENIKTETKLSTASLEVLTIIAYNEPVTKAYVEDVRGVNCDNVFHKLKLRNLIVQCGTDPSKPYNPALYKTTDDFMKYFNINSLDELPQLIEEKNEEKDIFTR